MTIQYAPEALEVFRLTADIVARESHHLESTRKRLLLEKIDAHWVKELETHQDLSERVEAFVSRLGRLQDTLGDKLLPKMALLVGLRPAAPVELLAKAEKLEWIQNANDWMEWRQLRNRLVHEYMTDPEEFAAALNDALQISEQLMETANQIQRYAKNLGLLS